VNHFESGKRSAVVCWKGASTRVLGCKVGASHWMCRAWGWTWRLQQRSITAPLRLHRCPQKVHQMPRRETIQEFGEGRRCDWRRADIGPGERDTPKAARTIWWDIFFLILALTSMLLRHPLCFVSTFSVAYPATCLPLCCRRVVPPYPPASAVACGPGSMVIWSNRVHGDEKVLEDQFV